MTPFPVDHGPRMRFAVLDDILGVWMPISSAVPIGQDLEQRSHARRIARLVPFPSHIELVELLRCSSERTTVEVAPVEDAQWMTSTQAALVSGVSPRAIQQRVARGALPGSRKINGLWWIPTHTIERHTR